MTSVAPAPEHGKTAGCPAWCEVRPGLSISSHQRHWRSGSWLDDSCTVTLLKDTSWRREMVMIRHDRSAPNAVLLLDLGDARALAELLDLLGQAELAKLIREAVATAADDA